MNVGTLPSKRRLEGWRNETTNYAHAKAEAKIVADRRQLPTSVLGKDTENARPVYRVAFTFEPVPNDWIVMHHAQPNPDAAPPDRWTIVKIGASHDKTMRDIEAETWREYSKRIALQAGSKTSVPYHVKTSDKPVRLHGRKMPLYTYVVRRNPRFPLTESLTIPPMDQTND